ncbi:hypothetical protein [Oceanicola sp. 502str15]|uniref:hypothetical protein n=1 Tax=Oceanicola sp. 502str15 TaxID=2696061 RepID=UPI0020944B62|nr:hypothetical protein [Oceanicola sp. 502str15]MCO6382433.1 hypothetical protein [Oceanicola sp. 502str15]
MTDSNKGFTQDLQELNRQHALRAFDQNRRAAESARNAAIDSANIVIRSLILVNGGAVIALLTFAGTIENGPTGPAIELGQLANSIRYFAFGVGSAVIVAACAYLVNMWDEEIISSVEHVWEHPYVRAKSIAKVFTYVRVVVHHFAIALSVTSILLFFLGIFSVTNTITSMNS